MMNNWQAQLVGCYTRRGTHECNVFVEISESASGVGGAFEYLASAETPTQRPDETLSFSGEPALNDTSDLIPSISTTP